MHKIALTILGLFLLLRIQSQQNIDVKPATPIIIGQSYEILSSELSEPRVLNIYLPEGYEREDTAKFPVIYLLDGSTNEDFLHVAGLVQFFNMMNMMPKIIVVGISNVNRKRDFTYPTSVVQDRIDFPSTGGSAQFISFLSKEVKPFVTKKFRTNGMSTIIGQSLGGLLVTEILMNNPDMFDRYIIVSPSLWWDNTSVIQEDVIKAYLDAPNKKTIYLAVGKEGDTMEKGAKSLHEVLKRNKNMTAHFQYLPDENHATILHQSLYNAFRILNPTKR